MTLKIIHKNNTSAGQAPVADDIDVGEIAINAADAKLFIKDTDGAVQEFISNFEQAGSGAVTRSIENKLRDIVSVKDFGAVGAAGPSGSGFGDQPASPRPDNTAAFQAAIDFCIASSAKLVIPPGTYFFKNANGLTINGNLELEGQGNPQLFYNPSLRSDPKNDAFLSVSGNKKSISNINFRSNTFLGKAICLETSDNQKLLLQKLSAQTFRYGLYCNEEEVINQLEVRSCRFDSNYYWGIYIDSYDGDTYGQSGPLHFFNTICNGNGPTPFAMSQTWDGVAIKDSDTDLGGQFYLRGFINAQYIGGQISGHTTSARERCAALIQNGTGFSFVGTDVEDVTNTYTSDGTTLITAANAESLAVSQQDKTTGAAIIVSSVSNFSCDGLHTWEIRTIGQLKMMNTVSNNYSIGNITCRDETFLYTVWDTNDSITGDQINYIHPSVLSKGKGVNNVAFQNLGNQPRNLCLLHNELAPIESNLPTTADMWTNGGIDTTTNGWRLAYLSDHDQSLDAGSTHLWNEVFINQYGSGAGSNGQTDNQLAFIYITAPYSNAGDGRLVMQALDGSGTILSSNWWKPNNFTSDYPISGTQRFDVPANCKSIRYGFVNSGNYNGNMKDHFMGNFVYNSMFFLRIEAVMTDTSRFGIWSPPYTAAVNQYRTATN